jgi:hypothetical protein
MRCGGCVLVIVVVVSIEIEKMKLFMALVLGWPLKGMNFMNQKTHTKRSGVKLNGFFVCVLR